MTGEPTRIKEGDILYNTIGDGWIYEFYITETVTDGESVTEIEREYTATLPEGTAETPLHMHTYDLQIVGQAEAGLLEIEIIEKNIE